MQGIRGHLARHIAVYVVMFLAMSSVATAAGVARNSIRSRHVKPDALTGADINESTLAVGRVVARARGSTPQITTDIPTAYPLTGASFTQQPGQLITHLAIQVQLDLGALADTSCILNAERVRIVAMIDGASDQLLLQQDFVGPELLDQVLTAFGPVFLFESPVATTRTVEVEVSDDCDDGDASVDSVAVDVIGVR